MWFWLSLMVIVVVSAMWALCASASRADQLAGWDDDE